MMKYFGYYADERNSKSVNCALSAVNKMTYIAEKIAEIDGQTEIISAVAPFHGTQHEEVYPINKSINVRYFKASCSSNKVISVFQRFAYQARLFVWAWLNIKKHEKILVYHSLGYMRMFAFLKRIKDFVLILEVEEIYSDVTGNRRDKKSEVRFFQCADAYVFPTQLLNEKINMNNKPQIIIHGTYKVEPCRENKKNFMDEKSNRVINCVYAGTLDPRKGGAIAAVTATEFLPHNYHMHILGFGSDDDIRNLQSIIKEISKKTEANLSYDGLLSGEEYIEFIQKCDIGLSTQNPNADFNDSSFPSKILSYLANGLHVVSVRIPVVECSLIGDEVVYYEEQTPREIAKAILGVNLHRAYDSREKIQNLSADFEKELRILIKEI